MLTDRGAQRVIVGVDGSEAALGAVVWGAQEAAQHNVSLTLLYVIDHSRAITPEVLEAEHQLAETILWDASAAVESVQQPVKVEQEIVCGDPATVLLHESRSAALLCVGAPKAFPHQPSDSLATSLATAASCSVVVVPPKRCTTRKPSSCLALGLDSSNVNYDALQIALEEAQRQGLSLHVVADGSAAPPVNELLGRWLRRYPDVDARVVHSDSILSYVSAQHGSIHVVVVGAERRGELAHLIGLTRSKTACYENPAVLVVRSRHL